MSHGQALVLLIIAIAMSAGISLLMWADHRRAHHRRPGTRPLGDTAPDPDRDRARDHGRSGGRA